MNVRDILELAKIVETLDPSLELYIDDGRDGCEEYIRAKIIVHKGKNNTKRLVVVDE